MICSCANFTRNLCIRLAQLEKHHVDQIQVVEPKPHVILPNASGLFTYKVPLSATVKDVNNGTLFPGIVVHFIVGSINAGSDTTDSSGVATVQFTVPETLPTGANKLKATADVSNGYLKMPISVI